MNRGMIIFVLVAWLVIGLIGIGCNKLSPSPRRVGFNVTFNDSTTAFYPGDTCYPEGSFIIIRWDSMAPARQPKVILGNVAKVEEVQE